MRYIVNGFAWLLFAWLLIVSLPVFSDSPIVINEIMYHPASDLNRDEYIELVNRGNEPVDMGGWFFSDGIRYSFPPGAVISPGEYWIVARNVDRIREKYGLQTVWGNYSGELSNEGERIALSNIDGDVVDEVVYTDSPPWPVSADEFGPSLECINPSEDNSRPANWNASQGIVDWTRITTEGIATGNALNFFLQNAGSAWVDDVRLFDLNGTRVEESVWPMKYRHTPGGIQTLDFHFSKIAIPLDSSRRIVRIQLPNEPRIFVFAITLQVGQDWTPVSLSYYFNTDGISNLDNPTDGDLDGSGSTYAAELLPEDGIVKSENSSPAVEWKLGSFQDGQNNAVRCMGQLVSISRVMGSYMYLLATAVNASTLQEKITVIYSDGSVDAPIQVTDWAVPIPDSESQQLDILLNGSFESTMSYWQRTGNHQRSRTGSEYVHNGNQALLLMSSGSGGTGGKVSQILSGIQAGGRYRLEYWVRAASGGNTVVAELEGGGLHTETSLGGEGTPGKPNSVWQETLPPFVEEYSHRPECPLSSDIVTIRARISCGDVIRSVSLHWTVNDMDRWTEMNDEGRNGDERAGDGVYGVRLDPQKSQTPVFYSICAVDGLGRVGLSPAASDPTPHHGYFVYDGEAASDLPIYFLFVDSADLSQLNRNPNSDEMVPATVVVEGKVFANVRIRYRGAWARSWPKKNWKIRFNKGNRYKGWRTSNLNGEYHDRAYMREVIGYDLFEDAGIPHPQARFVWMQLNREPFGLFCEIEQPDERFLKRIGRAGGSLYKSEGRYNVLGSESQYRQTYQKETNVNEPFDDLIAMIEEVNTIPDSRVYDYFIQHFQVENYIDYLVVNACISNWDSIVKNHFALQDSALTGKWEFIPWDLDRTWGEFPDWNLYANQDILAGVRRHPGPQLGSDWWNRVQDRFLNNSTFLTMYYNRMRQFLRTQFTEERMNARIDEIDASIRDETPLEKKIHGLHGSWNYANEVENLKKYVRDRRGFLFQSLPVDVENWQLH